MWLWTCRSAGDGVVAGLASPRGACEAHSFVGGRTHPGSRQRAGAGTPAWVRTGEGPRAQTLLGLMISLTDV